ncbi:hypothetical protein CMV_018373 [Castanea mollissima]|uniref:Pentatricopeptide repeat-containing protein n=1 Tax=Castanea mollissima TaxID=60419 RepID=A0A8J4VPN3_9ROSI|nr:hypothetical protein CMV_018373 [Castanea mollissima]
MSAKVRRVRNTLQVHFHSLYSQTLNPLNLTHSPKTLNPKPSHFTSSSSSSSSNSQNFDFLEQFLPHSNASSHSCSSSSSFSFSPIVVNSNERRRIAVGLSKAIKSQMGFVLKAFSKRFCPVSLVKVMKLFGTRETGFAFFKLAFRDGSDEAVRKCCVAAHILAAENLRFLAQDVVSCVIAKIGSGRSEGVVEFMWRNHREYESGFSVLDTLMRGFVNVEMSSEAIGVVGRMREVGLRPSLSAITVLFKLLLRVGDYGSVWKLFRDMVRRGPCPCSYTFNVMVLGFCRKGLVRIGESLLHVMWKFHCEPDVFTYNIVINAYCMRGRTSDALNWVHLMISRGCKPSVVTFNTVLHALCKEGNMVQARKLFDGIHDMGVYPDVTMFNTLMDGHIKVITGLEGKRMVIGLCWAGRFDEAMEFLENMLEKGIPPSVVAFNSIIAAYSRAGLEAKAYEAYRILVKFGLTPSSSTCSSLLMGLSQKGSLQEARELLYNMIENGFPINKVAYTVLLDGYSKIGDLEGAQNLWNEMALRGVSPDAVAYSAFIDGLSKADEFMNKMYASGWDPDVTTYNIRIHGFCSSRKMNRAVMMLDELVSAVTTNVVLSQFCKQGMPERALMWCQKLSEISFDFDEITYRIMDRAYRDIEEDAELFRGESAKSLFLDFLMYITYDFMYRNRPQREPNQNTLESIESAFGGS